MPTLATPGKPSKSLLTSSAVSYSTPNSVSPYKVTLMTGKRVFNRLISGVSACTGKSSIESTTDRTSLKKSSTSTSVFNFISILDKPSELSDVTTSTSGNVSISSSIKIVICFSISSGGAPSYSVVIRTKSKSTIGNISCGILRHDNTPAMTITSRSRLTINELRIEN